jgi:tRNA threonylcarbamoyladenosine biosynthesis protein TsaE
LTFDTRNLLQVTTHSPEETRILGQKIGSCIEIGTVITLTGDLGSGKTVFVQGLARGLAVPKYYNITSPTYTLINDYPGRVPLFHVDLYRINNPDDLRETGFYEILHGESVVTIEWADRLPQNTLSEHVSIHFEFLDDESRKIRIIANGPKPATLVKMIEKSYTKI